MKVTLSATHVIENRPADEMDGDLQSLKHDWPKLSAIKRGECLKILVDKGHSRRKIAGLIRRHESRIRQLLFLAELPQAERDAVGARGKGVKKSVAAARKRRAAQPRVRKPSKRSEKLKLRNARLIAKFIQKEGPPAGPYRSSLFDEMRTGPYGARAVEFDEAAAKANQAPLIGKAEEIIAQCRPSRPRPEYLPDELNFVIEWFAAWSAHIIPDKGQRYDAIVEAERLIQEI